MLQIENHPWDFKCLESLKESKSAQINVFEPILTKFGSLFEHLQNDQIFEISVFFH